MIRKEFPDQTRRLLLKEASLSSMNLGVGLTFLRKYNFAQLGFIYQAFFSLSIGIERLIKLIILYEYLCLHNDYPPNNFLKSKGHDINLLFIEAKSLSKKYSASKFFDKLDESLIYANILTNLSDFAKTNRYFALDKLSGIDNSEDPVARWDREINSIIIDLHFNPNTENNRNMMMLSGIFNEKNASFKHHDEQDRVISKSQDYFFQSITSVTKQKYSMYYCFCIIKALCELQRNQHDILFSNAFLYEFFIIFRIDYAKALTKKSWNPHAPYKF